MPRHDLKSRPQTKLIEQFKEGRLLHFRGREIVLRAGEEPQGIYYVNSGFVRAYSITDQGEENIHIIYQSGDIFPLVWAFKGIVRNIFYESVGPSKLFRLGKDDFINLVRDYPEVPQLLLQQLTDQLDVYADRLDNLEYTSASERVVYRLLFLGGRFGEKQGSKIVINLPSTHQHIARSINLARETVSREIEKLERRKLVSYKKRLLVLNDVQKLEELIGETASLDLWGLK